VLAAALLTLAVSAPTASARSVRLHYFSKQTSSTFVNQQGQPVTGAPAAGDINDITDIDYVGNHKHHAKTAAASDHLRCTITTFTQSAVKAICDGQIAIGGSMLLANHASVTVSDASIAFAITGGTGIYRHAHGTIHTTQVGNDSDFTIKVAY
jgi:hypothetical protein